MKIKDFISNPFDLSNEQYQILNELSNSLNIIVTNPGGHFYDFMDIKKYKELLSEKSKKFKNAFPGSNGLFSYQTDHYQLQMYLENQYKHPVEGIFSFEYSREVFRCAYLRELAIHIYMYNETKNSVSLYIIQLKAMAVWLLVTYFNIRDFKKDDFQTAFDVVYECLDDDFSIIKNAWEEIRQWRQENSLEIRKAQDEKNLGRNIMRKAQRIVDNKMMGKDLEICNFMARDRYGFTYKDIIFDVCRRFNMTRKTVAKRAKELGFDVEMYMRLRNDGENYWLMEEKRNAYYERLVETGPFDESTARKLYYKRFSRFRTFGSMISRDIKEKEIEQSEEIPDTLIYDSQALNSAALPTVPLTIGGQTNSVSKLFEIDDNPIPQQDCLHEQETTPLDINKALESVMESFTVTSYPPTEDKRRETININDVIDMIMS